MNRSVCHDIVVLLVKSKLKVCRVNFNRSVCHDIVVLLVKSKLKVCRVKVLDSSLLQRFRRQFESKGQLNCLSRCPIVPCHMLHLHDFVL